MKKNFSDISLKNLEFGMDLISKIKSKMTFFNDFRDFKVHILKGRE